MAACLCASLVVLAAYAQQNLLLRPTSARRHLGAPLSLLETDLANPVEYASAEGVPRGIESWCRSLGAPTVPSQ